MKDGLHFRFLDLPVLPKELEKDCLDFVLDENIILEFPKVFNTEYTMSYYGQLVQKKQCIFSIYRCPIHVKQWLLDHNVIPNLTTRVSIQRTYNGNTLLPHVDSGPNYLLPGMIINNDIKNTRKKAKNYLLTESGPKTCFYNTREIDDIIESVIFPKSVWHELDVDVLHGVEDISSERISLSVSF